MDRKTWLEERKKGLGGSDSPVVLGLSPFKSIMELWEEKRGIKDETEETPAMKRGSILEPIIADLYQQKTGHILNCQSSILHHENHPFLLANIDRQIVANGHGPGVLEIKCPGLRIFSKCKREGLPDYYIIQLQHYLAVTGYTWGAYAVFNAEWWEMIHFEIKRDDELINLIIEKDKNFWQMVINNTPPQIQEMELNLPPIGTSNLVKFDTLEWEKAINQLKIARDLSKEAKILETEAEENIQKLMDNATIAEGAGARIYWNWQDGKQSIDSKRLKKEKPDIHKEYSKKGKPYRTFRPYFLKEAINE